MSEAKEFNNVEDMKEYIVKQHTDDVMGEAFSRISKGEYFDICYTLQENEFMGKSDIQMMIRDLKFKEE